MIAFFLVLVAVMIAAEVYSLRHSLDGIEYASEPTVRITEPDEEVQLVTRVTNRQRRIVPFLRITEIVPLSFASRVITETESVTDKTGSVTSAVYMMPRQRMTRRIAFSLPERGRYLFPGARLSGGDFMGLSEQSRLFTQDQEIVVLPRRIDSAELDDLTGGMMGDISVNRFLFEDPVLTVGFRDYTGHEPLKAISWTATAKSGSVMVRNYDHTVERSVSVLLNLDTFGFGAYAEELIEKCYGLARSVCEELESKKIGYSFFTNAKQLSPACDSSYITEGYGPVHLARVLECLGRGERTHGIHLNALIADAASRAGSGDIVIYITPMREDAAEAKLAPLAARTGSRIYTVIPREVKE